MPPGMQAPILVPRLVLAGASPTGRTVARHSNAETPHAAPRTSRLLAASSPYDNSENVVGSLLTELGKPNPSRSYKQAGPTGLGLPKVSQTDAQGHRDGSPARGDLCVESLHPSDP